MKSKLFINRPLLFNLWMLTIFFSTIGFCHAQSIAAISLNKNARSSYDLPPGWEYQSNTDNPHFIIVMLGANPRLNNIPLLPGDFIGAFYLDNEGNKQCGGADFWLADENIVFPAFRDDPDTPLKDGFLAGEIIHFKVFLWSTQKEYEVSLIAFDLSYPSNSKWYSLGLSSVINMAAFTNFDVYATATPNPICIGDQVALSAEIFVGTTGNYTYSWTSDPPGFSSTQQSVTHFPSASTNYLLSVTDGTYTSMHNVLVTVNTAPQISPGANLTICANQSAQVTCFPLNYSGLIWSSTGDGSFDNPVLTSPIYTPGLSDLEAGSVTLTATAFPLSPCLETTSVQLSVSFLSLPSISLPPSLVFCSNQEIWLDAVASNFTTVLWSTSGDGAFSNPNSLTTRYIPGTFDNILGYFTLTCCANAVSGCTGSSCDQVLVNVTKEATLNAPSSRTRCENTFFQLSSSAQNYTSILWTTVGDGYFNNANLLSPIYYPGLEDISNNGTVVTVNALGNGVCELYPTTRNTTLIIVRLPFVNAGDNNIFYQDSSIQLNATAQFYTALMWSTSGDGNFSNPTILNPLYYPGANDLAAGTFDLTLTAQPLQTCAGSSVSDVLHVQLTGGAQVQILTPSGQEPCQSASFGLNATASVYDSLLWTTSGDGLFGDAFSLNTVYYPGPVVDFSGIPTQLTLTAFAPAGFGNDAVQSIFVTFNTGAIADAGEDAISVEREVFIPGAVASFYDSIFWETSGDGQFSDLNSLITEYTPGIEDLRDTEVVLTLFAYDKFPCTGSTMDQVSLTVKRKQVLNFSAGWQGFSSFIVPDDSNFEQLMEPVSDQLHIAMTMTQTYWPEFDINTIQDFSNHDGYRIRFYAPATLEIIGFESQQKTLIIPAGWSIMPVLSGCNVEAEEITGQLGDNLIIITEIAGNNMIWPSEGIFGIWYFLSGKAYMIKLAQQSSVTFPDCVP